MSTKSTAKVLLLDDDSTFCKVFAREAKRSNVKADTCETVDQFCLKALNNDYDIVMIDYNLGQLKGNMVAKVIETKSVILISHDSEVNNSADWPYSVTGFIGKSQPISQLMGEMLEKSQTLKAA